MVYAIVSRAVHIVIFQRAHGVGRAIRSDSSTPFHDLKDDLEMIAQVSQEMG